MKSRDWATISEEEFKEQNPDVFSIGQQGFDIRIKPDAFEVGILTKGHGFPDVAGDLVQDQRSRCNRHAVNGGSAAGHCDAQVGCQSLGQLFDALHPDTGRRDELFGVHTGEQRKHGSGVTTLCGYEFGERECYAGFRSGSCSKVDVRVDT